MLVKSEEKAPGKSDCPHCWAEEGQLHHWGCEHDACPFCGHWDMMCDCYDNMVEVAKRSKETVRPACMTAVHEKRWLELVGDLHLKRQDLLDSPFNEEDFHFECPPEWCHTDAQYKAYWKLQEKFMKIEDLLFRKWKILCMEEGRHPQIQVPNMCACCGALWPEMFSVPDEEWQKYALPQYQEEMLCLECFNHSRELFPGGWDSKLAEIEQAGRSWEMFLIRNGLSPVCGYCGTQEDVFIWSLQIADTYVPPQLAGEPLCTSCMDKLKRLFPRGWKKARKPRSAVGAKGK